MTNLYQNEMLVRPNTMLWLDDHRGVYIPRDFANSFADRAKTVEGVEEGDWEILEYGPDHDLYWEVWDDVLNNATVTDDKGVVYTLHQDGALWLVPEGMEWSEENKFFVWSDEVSEQ